jgi:hypothetical protein
MAGKRRVEYPGAMYHVMNRGDRREMIFLDDADRQRFVETLGEACAKRPAGRFTPTYGEERIMAAELKRWRRGCGRRRP